MRQLREIDGGAQGCGAAGFTLEDSKHVTSVRSRALEHRGPAVIQAVVDPDKVPLPGNIRLEQRLHFAKAPVRDAFEKMVREVN